MKEADGIAISSLSDFEGHIGRLAANTDGGVDEVLFRGQGDAAWPLSTTLERAKGTPMSMRDYYRLLLSSRPEIEAFTDISWSLPTMEEVDTLSTSYDAFSLKQTFEGMPGANFMAYLRHHGFPSPLLDWTRSPYVAVYFAMRHCRPNSAAAVYVFVERPHSTKIWSSDRPLIFPFNVTATTHRRHFLQQSTYTMCARYDAYWWFSPHDSVFNQDREQDVLYRFVFPPSLRLDVLRNLDQHNLNAFSLFGTDESLMETIAQRKLDFDS